MLEIRQQNKHSKFAVVRGGRPGCVTRRLLADAIIVFLSLELIKYIDFLSTNHVSGSRQVEYILKVGQSTLTYVSIWFCR